MRYLSDSEDSLNERRVDLGIQALEEAQNSATGGKSTAALLPVRVALAMVFMYLVMFSYTMMGPTGVIIISVLFIASLLVPAWIWMWLIRGRRRKKRRVSVILSSFSRFAQNGDVSAIEI